MSNAVAYWFHELTPSASAFFLGRAEIFPHQSLPYLTRTQGRFFRIAGLFCSPHQDERSPIIGLPVWAARAQHFKLCLPKCRRGTNFV